jgi:hypothetical protein
LNSAVISVAGRDDAADGDHQVGKAAHQVGQDAPQHVRTAAFEAERMHGHRHLRINHGDGGVDVMPGECIQERLHDLRGCHGHADPPWRGGSGGLAGRRG